MKTNLKRTQIPSWKNIPDLMGLIYLADINFLVCKKIYSGPLASTIKYWPAGVQKSLGYDFLLLAANNSFFEAVSIIHTLVCSNKKQEVRVQPLLTYAIEKDKKFVSKITNYKVNQFVKNMRKDYPNPNYASYAFLTKDDNRLVGDIMAEIRNKKRIESGLDDLKKVKEKFEGFNFHKIRHQTAAHKNKFLDNPSGASHLLVKDDLIKKLEEVIKDLRMAAYFWFDYQMNNPNKYILDSLETLLTDRKTI